MTDPYADSEDYNDISENETSEPQIIRVPTELGGERLDAALAKMLPDYSRSRLTAWIKDGQVKVDGVVVAPKTKLLGGEMLEVQAISAAEEMAYEPEDIPLNVLFEDEHILVINKPAGLVVHPAAGNWTGTLLNGLLFHYPALAQVPRAGIVHRLDKDTSGLMVVAKTIPAQTDLVRQMQARTVKRIYRAVADGIVPFDGTIDANIGRDPHNRLRMAVVKFGGKPAITHLRVLERYNTHCYVECQLETGRTHQIRVHMKEARHPLAGDPVYGNPRLQMSDEARTEVRALGRQALHAFSLSLVHPATGETMTWKARLPKDLRDLLALLREESGYGGRDRFRAGQSGDEEWEDGEEWDDEEDDDDEDYDVEVHYVRD